MLNLFAGLMAFAAALHLSWLWYLPRIHALDGLTSAQLDFLQLLNLALVCTFVAFGVGALLVAHSRVFELVHMRIFAGFMFAFWSGRLVLELVLPVRIEVLGAHSSAIILVLLVAGLGLIAWPEVRLRSSRDR